MSVLEFIYLLSYYVISLTEFLVYNNSVFYSGFSDANKFNLWKKLYYSLTEEEIQQLLEEEKNYIFHQILPSFMECCKVLMLQNTLYMIFYFRAWDKTVFGNILKVFDNNV